MAGRAGRRNFSLTVKTGGRRGRKNNDLAQGAALLVLIVLAVSLWQRLSWWLVVFAAVPVIGWLLAIQWGWLRQHRRKLAPAFAGVAVASMAASSKGIVELGGYSWWVLAVYAALTAGIGWAVHLEESKDHRVFYAVALGAALAWTLAVHQTSWSRWADLAGAWLVLVILASAFWWTDRRVIHEVRAEERIRSWPEIVRGTELAGTSRTHFEEKPEGGWRMRLAWAPGRKLVDSMTKLSRLLESVMDAPPRSVTCEGDGANAMVADCSPVGALGALPWDGESAVSASQPSDQARYAGGKMERYQRWVDGVGGRHKVRLGMSRSGKSRAARHDLCVYGPAEDVVVMLIDLKGGAAFRPFAPLADWFATRAEDAVLMLEALVRLCDVRAHWMAEQGWEVWQPSREYPVIWLEVDETAKLTGMQARPEIMSRALSAMVELSQIGAGVGLVINVMTQFGTLEALGSTQLRENLHITECYRMRTEGTAGNFVPNIPPGVEPAQIPASRKGSFYADVEGEFQVQLGLKPDVTDEQMQDVVGEYWQTTPEIEERHRAVLGEAYERRDRWRPDGTGKVLRVAAGGATDTAPEVDDRDEDDEPDATSRDTGAATAATAGRDTSQPLSQPEYAPAWAGVDEDAPTFRECVAASQATMSPEERAAEKARLVAYLEQTRPVDPAQAPEIVWRLLVEAPDGQPVSPGDAQRASGLSESTVHRLLRRWEDEGRVEHVGRGAYVRVAGVPVGAR